MEDKYDSCQMFQSIIIGVMFTQALFYRWHKHHPYTDPQNVMQVACI